MLGHVRWNKHLLEWETTPQADGDLEVVEDDVLEVVLARSSDGECDGNQLRIDVEDSGWAGRLYTRCKQTC